MKHRPSKHKPPSFAHLVLPLRLPTPTHKSAISIKNSILIHARSHHLHSHTLNIKPNIANTSIMSCNTSSHYDATTQAGTTTTTTTLPAPSPSVILITTFHVPPIHYDTPNLPRELLALAAGTETLPPLDP
jgi:hypothetical protein